MEDESKRVNQKIPPAPDKKVPPKPPPDKEKPVEPEVIIQKEKVYLDNNIVVQPPTAHDLEEAVLGAYMVDGKTHETMKLLRPFIFHLPSHQHIYAAMEKLMEEDPHAKIDLLTVSDTLKRMGKLKEAGSDYYLIKLTQKVSSTAHVEFHIRILLQKYMLREIISNCRNVMHKSLHNDPDVFHLMDSIEANIARIKSVAIKKLHEQENNDPKKELREKVKKVEAGETPGIYTGISEFDEWCGGFQPRELITIAARPGMGKTTLGLSICSTVVWEKREKVAFFSLEMSSIDLKYRIAARLTQIPYSQIRKGELNFEELQKVEAALDEIDNSSLVISDTSKHKNKLEKILDLIRQLVLDGYKEIFIDYVQLIKLMKSSGDRTSDLSTITRELKATANELNIPIIAFAQLNRGVESRNNKTPLLSDLKQSGSIEEDSDTVCFIVRDAYYQEREESGVKLPPHIAGDARFIVAKGRNIGTDVFRIFIDFMKYQVVSYSDSGY